MSIDEKLTFIVGRRVYIYIYIYIYTHIYTYTHSHTHTHIYMRERERIWTVFMELESQNFLMDLGDGSNLTYLSLNFITYKMWILIFPLP